MGFFDAVVGLAQIVENSHQAKAARLQQKEEAEKQRLWSEKREDTAHQREVADLRAAGLSPTLSAGGGAGAGSYQQPIMIPLKHNLGNMDIMSDLRDSFSINHTRQQTDLVRQQLNEAKQTLPYKLDNLQAQTERMRTILPYEQMHLQAQSRQMLASAGYSAAQASALLRDMELARQRQTATQNSNIFRDVADFIQGNFNRAGENLNLHMNTPGHGGSGSW